VLRELQFKKLAAVIAHACDYVPFYRKRFKEIGFLPGDLKRLEDLEKIPPVSRQDVIDYHREMVDKKSKIRPKVKTIYTINTLNPISWTKTAKKINEFNPDKVIFQWVSPFFSLCFRIISSLLRAKKIVFLCHNVIPHEHTRLDNLLTRMAFKNATSFYVHSEEDKKNTLKIKANARVEVVKHPLYNVFYKKVSKKEAQKKLGVSGKVILFFGLVRKYKRLDSVLENWKKYEDQGYTLLIAGKFVANKRRYEYMIRKLNLNNIKIRILFYLNFLLTSL